MNSNLIEIQQNLPSYDDFVNWYNQKTYCSTDLEFCQRWQLREALSFYFTKPTVTNATHRIVKAVAKKRNYSWKNRPLTIVEEAVIQRQLREQGIELLGCDIWPMTSTELVDLSTTVTFSKRVKYRVLDKLLSKLQGFSLQRLDQYRYLCFFIIGILLFQQWAMLAQGLLIGFICWIFLDFARHEYIEHDYLIPKNTIVKYFVDIFMFYLSPPLYHDRYGVVEIHFNHHRYWNTNKDNLSNRVKTEFIPGLVDYDLGFLKQPDLKSLNKLSSEYKIGFLFRYFVEIKVLVLAVLTLIFGPAAVFYYTLIPITIVGFLQLQHDFYLDRFGETDHPWLWPITFNQAWHLEHHKTYKTKPNSVNSLFMGPSWVKYINPQYYFARLLFRLNSSVSRQ